MNLITYQKETKRTLPDLGNEATNLSHMVLGICSEFSEYLDAQYKNDKVNLTEELIDKNWYLSNYCNLRNYSLNELYTEADRYIEQNIDEFKNFTNNNYFYCLAELQDLVKKNLAYGKIIDREVEKDKLISYIVCLKFLYTQFDFDLERGLENNINKLKKRFPDKFNKENAINRNLEVERIELEK